LSTKALNVLLFADNTCGMARREATAKAIIVLAVVLILGDVSAQVVPLGDVYLLFLFTAIHRMQMRKKMKDQELQSSESQMQENLPL
jgi:hypothetical protein